MISREWATYHLLVLLKLFEFLIHLRYLRLCTLARFICILQSVFNSLYLKLVFGVLLHKRLFLLHVCREEVLCISQGIL